MPAAQNGNGRNAHDILGSSKDTYCHQWLRWIEVIRRRLWKSCEEGKLATLDWADWLNQRHLLGPIGNVPLAEGEANYYRQRDTLRATR